MAVFIHQITAMNRGLMGRRLGVIFVTREGHTARHPPPSLGTCLPRQDDYPSLYVLNYVNEDFGIMNYKSRTRTPEEEERGTCLEEKISKDSNDCKNRFETWSRVEKTLPLFLIFFFSFSLRTKDREWWWAKTERGKGQGKRGLWGPILPEFCVLRSVIVSEARNCWPFVRLETHISCAARVRPSCYSCAHYFLSSLIRDQYVLSETKKKSSCGKTKNEEGKHWRIN